MVDQVVHRHDLKKTLARLVRVLRTGGAARKPAQIAYLAPRPIEVQSLDKAAE
jgi:hypothetical protein